MPIKTFLCATLLKGWPPGRAVRWQRVPPVFYFEILIGVVCQKNATKDIIVPLFS